MKSLLFSRNKSTELASKSPKKEIEKPKISVHSPLRWKSWCLLFCIFNELIRDLKKYNTNKIFQWSFYLDLSSLKNQQSHLMSAIRSSSAFEDRFPTVLSTYSPFLKKISVGIASRKYFSHN